jgi:antitoxin PrlF
MDAKARLTSKGQITIPRGVREVLGLETGDEVLFRVEQGRAVMAKTSDFLDLAGSVAIPAGKRGTAWDDVLRSTHRDLAARRR